MDTGSQKKTIILESTLELVREHGINGFPISEIAKKGGIAVGTIYHYFEGKDELIRELYDYVVNLIYQAALVGDYPSKDFKSRYFDLWRNLVELYCGKPSILSFFELYSNSSYYSTGSDFEGGKFYEWLFDFFEEGLQSKDLRPINKKILIVLVLGNMHTAAKVKINRRLRSNNKEIDLVEISRIVWEGIKNIEK